MRLKLLSGTLGGAEYPVNSGDTVFVFGPQRNLLSGTVAETLASAENIYYVPDDQVASTFTLRVGHADDITDVALQIGRADAHGHWHFESIVPQHVCEAGGVYLAVRACDADWSSQVLDFVPPVPGHTLQTTPPEPPTMRRKYALYAACMIVACSLALYGWLKYSAPTAQVRALEEELRRAPMDYVVAYGSDKRLYAFTDHDDGVAWGERAQERLGHARKALFMDRHRESERLGRLLSDAGMDYVIIRLRNPSRPEIVLSRRADADAAGEAARARALLAPSMPYAKEIHVDSVSDQWLMTLVRNDLRSRGITSRVDRSGSRMGISNDSFLDDAGLHAMSRYRQAFQSQWGARRVSINILLWDDVLKGRSFHYTPEQLLSVGGGVWQFNNTVNQQ